jgi:hypothetical protein
VTQLVGWFLSLRKHHRNHFSSHWSIKQSELGGAQAAKGLRVGSERGASRHLVGDQVRGNLTQVITKKFHDGTLIEIRDAMD